MINPTAPVFPKSIPGIDNPDGLTKLEYFAAAALTGLLASWAGAESDPNPDYIAAKAIEYAIVIVKKLPGQFKD